MALDEMVTTATGKDVAVIVELGCGALILTETAPAEPPIRKEHCSSPGDRAT